MSEQPLILLAEDDSSIRTVLFAALSRAGFDVKMTTHAATLWQWVSNGEGDLILTDVNLPDENMFNILPKVKKARPSLPVIVMSAENTVMTAIRASEVGAYDYLPKPFDFNELTAIVKKALKEQERAVENERKQAPKDDLNLPIIGRSLAMQDVYRTLARLMNTELTVMVYGESGTGKELVAHALHDFGKRKKGPFVAINMAAIPKDLIESELFGYEKGAFTGADQRKAGRFEQAEGGTLFLDEIGDMHIDAQTRLLRVLQEGEYTRVGGHKPLRANVRIIAATHKDLHKRIEAGLFREDLFYRLNVVPITMPPLRQRLDDIPDLVAHFVKRAQKENLPEKQFSPEAMNALKQHKWPGNVRELENMVWRILALSPEDEIDELSILSELSHQQFSSPPSASKREGEKATKSHQSLQELIQEYLEDNFDPLSLSEEDLETGCYQPLLAEFEIPLIKICLKACNGNQLKASKILGLNRNTLRKKMSEYQILAKAIEY